MARRRLPSLNALLAFEAAGRLGSMTRAGAELGVTHGVVSRQVAHLEAALGAALFGGPKHRRSLTPAGRALLGDLPTGFDRIAAGVRGVSQACAGALDVSCLGTFTMRRLIPRLHRFQAARPGMAVRLSASDSPVEFAHGAFEVAIRASDHTLPEGALLTRLFEKAVGPVLAPSLAAGCGSRDVRELAGLPMLHTRTRPGAWADCASRVGWAAGASPPGGTSYEHFYLLLRPRWRASAPASRLGRWSWTTWPRGGSSRRSASSRAGFPTSLCGGPGATRRRRRSAPGWRRKRAPRRPPPPPTAPAP